MGSKNAIALVVFLFLIWLTFLFLRPIDSDGDFFQHLNIGKYVLTNNTLPHFDNLTFTAEGKEYVGYSWLSGTFFYLLYSNLGPISINILVWGIALLTIALLYLYLRILKVSPLISIITILVTAPVIATRWPTRPEIVIYPFLLGFLLLSEGWQKRKFLLLLYPLLTLLLVNLYGNSFPAFAALFLLLIAKVFYEDKLHIKKTSMPFYLSIISCFPLALLNGYGLKTLLFIILIPQMTELWGDWGGIVKILESPTLYGFSGAILYGYLLYIGFFLLIAAYSRKTLKRQWFFAMLALSLFVPFFAIRHRALAALISAPLLAFCLTDQQKLRSWLLYLSIVISGILTLAFLTVGMPNVGGNEQIFPPKMISFIKSNDLNGRVFNTQQIGSFLSYSLSPDVKTFTDTRDDLFVGTGVLEELTPFLTRGASLNYLLRKHDVDFVILSVSDGYSIRDILNDSKWSLVYFDNRYLVFVPQNVARSKNIPEINSAKLQVK